jgi:hypothetical protein
MEKNVGTKECAAGNVLAQNPLPREYSYDAADNHMDGLSVRCAKD